jgi:hypothetical protein
MSSLWLNFIKQIYEVLEKSVFLKTSSDIK